jgi:hypothetical protein
MTIIGGEIVFEAAADYSLGSQICHPERSAAEPKGDDNISGSYQRRI